MDKPFDSWGKFLWELRGLASLKARREVELLAEHLSLDLRLDPEGALSEEARLILGEAWRLASSPACVELYSTPPKPKALLRSLRKYLVVLEEEARAALWIVFSQRWASSLRRLKASPLRNAPPGFYDLGSQGVQRLVVVSELPATPETLFLRLLGRGDVLRAALHEVLNLPVEHPLGRSITERLGPFRDTFAQLGLLPRRPSREDTMLISEILTPDIIAAYDARMERERQAIRQRAIEEGRQEGHEEGLERGLKQGELLVLSRFCQRTLGRPLSEEEHAGLARRLVAEGLDATTDAVTERGPEELLAWLGGGA